ncbi:amino acid ABC transporter ATP-binding protein, PAAT family (TC 3.A.1.3.-) [Aureimonas altamirensis DSM 21988]|jgi:polar amino acid transport system ATP-binding protein|uniref:ABC transporter n=2 Tax=Aureimonas altamirensis TaxID=370622 RepID=A0A0P0YVV7_9HYPH|nr:amino acid ABC transporter ATP-binding protein [Aureimonas altamirensis]BAT25541.1 ABC transporter [Aureimonas altamirensis]SHI39153.1 amino acid ABC transporter ATP-binding protein, PAAT family (TC 3.A.1.3.-) [Aureimonas altamirensis DSM 21988]
MSPQPAPLIQIRDIHKSFGRIEVLKGISLDVTKGEAVCIIGPSGSGKSTILRCINGLTTIDSGQIRVGDHHVERLHSERAMRPLRRQVAMVFQQYNLFPHKTALENVMMAPIQVLGHDREEVRARALANLAKVRLSGKEDHYPGELSGGQQQRVAIARALAMQPEIILFDEVTAALDPETVKDVLTAIRDLVEDGLTCILVTHEMRFAREVADRVCFTDRGLIVESAPPAELFDSPKEERTREFLAQIL